MSTATANGKKPKERPVRELVHPYAGADGSTILEVVRREYRDGRKDIVQRRPVPDRPRVFVWSIADVPRPLPPYRLPEILALEPGSTVLVVEGEKHADRLASLGIAATTSVMGAGKASQTDWGPMKGLVVVLVPDNDDVGREHQRDVGARCREAGAESVRWLELPGLGPKGDVLDWLDAGGAREELLKLILGAPDWEGDGSHWQVKAEAERIRSYILAAVRKECDKLASTPDGGGPHGGRHKQTIASAKAVGGFLHYGAVSREEMTAALVDASRRSGKYEEDPDKADDAIAAGLDYGEAAKRYVPGPEEEEGEGGVNAHSAGKTRNGHAGANRSSNGRYDPGAHNEHNAQGDADDERPVTVSEFPEPMAEGAFSGLLGEIVGLIEPETEADRVSILAQLHGYMGPMLGRGPFFMVEDTPHYCNEFFVLAGDTARARKGTSERRVQKFCERPDPEFVERKVIGSVSSAEGIIGEVRDAVTKREPIREKSRVTGYQDVEIDPGVSDKRLLISLGEFVELLNVAQREGNKLTSVLRDAWDGKRTLGAPTKTNRTIATDASIGFIGHVTVEELAHTLRAVDAANGVFNRFVWLAVRRSKLLPFGGSTMDEIDRDGSYRDRFSRAIQAARNVGRMSWGSVEAEELWAESYRKLSAPRSGMLGKVLARAEAHVLRLAMRYALIDGRMIDGGRDGRMCLIYPEHVRSALAFWDYAERSAAYIFGDKLGDPDAEAVLEALRAAPAGMKRTQIRNDVFSGHRSPQALDAILGRLIRDGLVVQTVVQTGGRPATIFTIAKRDAH